MTVNIALWLSVPLILCNSIESIVGLAADLPPKDEPAAKKTFCTSERVYSLNGYDCSNMNLKDVPQKLKTGVEVRQYSTSIFWFIVSVCVYSY